MKKTWSSNQKRNIRRGIAFDACLAVGMLILFFNTGYGSLRLGSGVALVSLCIILYLLRKKEWLDSYKDIPINEIKFWKPYLAVFAVFIAVAVAWAFVQSRSEEDFLKNRRKAVEYISNSVSGASSLVPSGASNYNLAQQNYAINTMLPILNDELFRAMKLKGQYSERLVPFGVDSCLNKLVDLYINELGSFAAYAEKPLMSNKDDFFVDYEAARNQSLKCQKLIDEKLNVYVTKRRNEEEAARKEQEALLQKSMADQIKTTPDASKANSVACETLTFFKGLGANAFYSPYTPGSAPGLSPAQKAIKNIISNSDVGNARLPSWVKDWLQNPSVDPAGKPISNCALYNGQEWYFLYIFKAHAAPDAHGALYVDLTAGMSHIRVYKTVLKSNGDVEEQLTFSTSSDPYWQGVDDAFGPLISEY